MRLLFMHNAVPEYRIPWFKKVAELCDTYFVFTNERIIKKLYYFETDYKNIEDLNYEMMGLGFDALKNSSKLLTKVPHFDAVILPPIDTLHEFWISFLVLCKAKKHSIKTAYFWEKWEAPKKLQPIRRRLINILTDIVAGIIYKKVDVVFAGSYSSKKYFERHGVEANKIIVLPDASSTLSYEYVDIRKKFSIPKDKIIILFFGRLLFQKGLFSLIQAFEKLEEGDNYFLLVAGDGEDADRTKKYIQDHSITNVAFAGWVHSSKRGNFFAQSDIFVLPGNFYEGRVDVWGLTIVEAIENGKVLVSTNAVGSSVDLIRNGVNGYILDATEINENFINELAKAIEVSSNVEFRESAKRYNKQIYKKYTYDVMAESLISGLKGVF